MRRRGEVDFGSDSASLVRCFTEFSTPHPARPPLHMYAGGFVLVDEYAWAWGVGGGEGVERVGEAGGNRSDAMASPASAGTVVKFCSGGLVHTRSRWGGCLLAVIAESQHIVLKRTLVCVGI